MIYRRMAARRLEIPANVQVQAGDRYQAAALRFDAVIMSEVEQVEDVSKMLAKDGDSDSAPRGIRTHDPRFRRPVLLSAEL